MRSPSFTGSRLRGDDARRAAASSPFLEVDNRVHCEDQDVALCGVGVEPIPAEGFCAIGGFIARNLRPDIDARRKPMLPSERKVIVARLDPGALPVQVVIILGAESQIV